MRGDSEFPETGDKGLKSDAIGFFDGVIIGVAATAPAAGLAAGIGLMVATVGVQAPAVLLASFFPMFLVASAFYYMNRADQDCGTAFSWVTRAMGPWAGWMAGWAICAASILVMGALADVASRYTLLLVAPAAADSKAAVTALAVIFIAVMTVVCVVGIETSARVQNLMIVAQVLALMLFAVVALAKVAGGDAPGSLRPEVSWFSPFAVESPGVLVSGLLIGVFMYWGWDSTVNLTEETRDSATAPGRAAVLSTVIILLLYSLVGAAVVAFAGVEAVAGFADDDAILGTVATGVLGEPLDKLVHLAVLSSALAVSQINILAASRTSLSMAHAHAMPASLARVHPRYLTPHVSTIVFGALGAAWYASLNLVADDFLYDTLSGLTLMVALYYALTGFACVIYYRRELLKSVKNFVFMGAAPLVGAGLLTCVLVESLISLADPGESLTGSSVFGLGLPFVMGLSLLVLGGFLMVLWRSLGGHGDFFERRGLEAVDPAVANGRVAAPTNAGKTRPGS